MRYGAAIAGAIFAVTGTALLSVRAQETAHLPKYISAVKVTATPAKIAAGGKGTLTLTLAVSPGFHINAHQPTDASTIATVLTPVVAKKAVVQFGTPAYPAPLVKKMSYSPDPQKVYEGTVKITVPFTVNPRTAAGKTALALSLEVQGCNDAACFPPATLAVSAPLEITAKAKP